MDMKILFLSLFGVILLYNTNVNSDEYATCVCQNFKVDYKELYNFVTFSGTVDKVYIEIHNSHFFFHIQSWLYRVSAYVSNKF